ncbi:MAG: hypothetical protein K2L00_05885, partial [Muribaculaceae bacterium]|nr:hypothetical protein [Muribaculaceae bacterium]
VQAEWCCRMMYSCFSVLNFYNIIKKQQICPFWGSDPIQDPKDLFLQRAGVYSNIPYFKNNWTKTFVIQKLLLTL